MKVGVDKFAEVYGIERNIAYGFLRFIAEAKLVQTSKRPQPKGLKGKPATLYHLDAGLGDRLVAHIGARIGQFASDNEIAEAVAENQIGPAIVIPPVQVEQATSEVSQ